MKQYWIKERHNPQLGIYYIACGQLSKSAAMRMEDTLYGFNVMYPYDTEEEYQDRLKALRNLGNKIP